MASKKPTLGQKLKALRERKDEPDKYRTQRQLAKDADLNRLTIWKVENDQIPDVSVRTIRKLAKALGVTVGALIDTDGE